MSHSSRRTLSFSLVVASTIAACSSGSRSNPPDPALIALGQQIFRHDTFGDEVNWTDALQLHTVVETLTPRDALAVGLKVDVDAVPAEVLANADFDDPATTLALIELDAVLGVVGQVDNGQLERLGLSCAFCHSTVDDSFAPGIGRRLDGWQNSDLDVGRILSLSPVFQDPDSQASLLSWGPGRYDARFNQDGISDPSVIPPAYGLQDTQLATYTGDGDISYWNAYVAITQMGGLGNFQEPRLSIEVSHDPDLVTPKLAALRAYQHSLVVPTPLEGSFDVAAAALGQQLFDGAAGCARCHSGPSRSDANLRLHAPDAIGTDPLHAQRSATQMYRTTPLRALAHHAPYFHNGSAQTLLDVVEHYDGHFGLGLTEDEKSNLAEYLKSL